MPDHNRTRSKCVNFHVTPEEYMEITKRIAVCGMPKGEYFIRSLLHQQIIISVGKFQSDRLSVEIKKLRERLEDLSENDEIKEILDECKALLEQLKEITEYNAKLSKTDFAAKASDYVQSEKEGDELWRIKK